MSGTNEGDGGAVPGGAITDQPAATVDVAPVETAATADVAPVETAPAKVAPPPSEPAQPAVDLSAVQGLVAEAERASKQAASLVELAQKAAGDALAAYTQAKLLLPALASGEGVTIDLPAEMMAAHADMAAIIYRGMQAGMPAEQVAGDVLSLALARVRSVNIRGGAAAIVALADAAEAQANG